MISLVGLFRGTWRYIGSEYNGWICIQLSVMTYLLWYQSLVFVIRGLGIWNLTDVNGEFTKVNTNLVWKSSFWLIKTFFGKSFVIMGCFCIKLNLHWQRKGHGKGRRGLLSTDVPTSLKYERRNNLTNPHRHVNNELPDIQYVHSKMGESLAPKCARFFLAYLTFVTWHVLFYRSDQDLLNVTQPC